MDLMHCWTWTSSHLIWTEWDWLTYLPNSWHQIICHRCSLSDSFSQLAPLFLSSLSGNQTPYYYSLIWRPLSFPSCFLGIRNKVVYIFFQFMFPFLLRAFVFCLVPIFVFFVDSLEKGNFLFIPKSNFLNVTCLFLFFSSQKFCEEISLVNDSRKYQHSWF